MKRRTLQSMLLLAAISSTGALGQINCAGTGPASQKLVCQIPFSTGVFTNNTSAASAQAAILDTTAFNSAIATQVSQLPLATASAGTVVLYKAGIPQTFNNLGPILTDRAQTVGRHKFFLGFTASQFVFTHIDGIGLGKVPFAFVATAVDPNTQKVLSNTYTSENLNIHFTVGQATGVATFGITDRIDASVIVPIERISIGDSTSNAQAWVLDANNNLAFGPYSIASATTPGTASGVGDILFNAKGELWRGEHATFSAGMNLRTPTGDDRNYLGSGAFGVNPYLVYSYLWKVSPHAKIGYQWNTATELNNPTSTAGGNKSLPGGLQYDLGADWAALKRVTLAADLLGSQYLNAIRLVDTVPIVLPIPNTTNPPVLPTISTQTASYSINDLSVGAKWNPYRNLVLSANVLFQLNNNGLRARPTPLVGISYKF